VKAEIGKGEKMEMKTADHPCASCPWRRSNQDKHHPHGWYTKANLRRLWNGLRTGKAPGMTCHPTDDRIELPEGAKAVPAGIEVRECAGAILLVIRELRKLEAAAGSGETQVQNYFRSTERGFTRRGLKYWVARAIFGGTPLALAIPNVSEDSEIHRPDLLRP
jgi:hypothetical protein